MAVNSTNVALSFVPRPFTTVMMAMRTHAAMRSWPSVAECPALP
jgi:hypothetical protein